MIWCQPSSNAIALTLQSKANYRSDVQINVTLGEHALIISQSQFLSTCLPHTLTNSFLLQFLSVLPTYHHRDSHPLCLFPNAEPFPSLLPPPPALSTEHESLSSESCVIEWAARAVSPPVIPISGWQERRGWRECLAEANITGYPLSSSPILLLLSYYLPYNENEHHPPHAESPTGWAIWQRNSLTRCQEWTHTCDCCTHICCIHIYMYTHTLTHKCSLASPLPCPCLHHWELRSRELVLLGRIGSVFNTKVM